MVLPGAPLIAVPTSVLGATTPDIAAPDIAVPEIAVPEIVWTAICQPPEVFEPMFDSTRPTAVMPALFGSDIRSIHSLDHGTDSHRLPWCSTDPPPDVI
jgi:hypothetical protein